MLRFCANVTMMFADRPFLDRLAAAKAAGFDGVEILNPYGVDPDELREACRKAGVEIANFNTPMGDRSRGDVGMAGVPGRQAEFREGVALARRYGEAVGGRQINVLAGMRPEGADRAACLDVLAENLAYAAAEMEKAGIGLTFEPINNKDRPAYIVNEVPEAAEIVARVGHKNLGIEADIYHMGMMGEDVAASLRRHAPHLGHVQFADVPGRAEPGSGGLDFPTIFKALDETGYGGWVSAEYEPSRHTEETLGWYAPWRR